jgi:hypothetical protein
VNCYECATIRFVGLPAIATCAICSAAVCAQHAHVRSREFPQPASPGRPVVHEARVITCSSCEDLERHNVPLSAGAPSSLLRDMSTW